jgi:hypothetical protein
MATETKTVYVLETKRKGQPWNISGEGTLEEMEILKDELTLTQEKRREMEEEIIRNRQRNRILEEELSLLVKISEKP